MNCWEANLLRSTFTEADSSALPKGMVCSWQKGNSHKERAQKQLFLLEQGVPQIQGEMEKREIKERKQKALV